MTEGESEREGGARNELRNEHHACGDSEGLARLLAKGKIV